MLPIVWGRLVQIENTFGQVRWRVIDETEPARFTASCQSPDEAWAMFSEWADDQRLKALLRVERR